MVGLTLQHIGYAILPFRSSLTITGQDLKKLDRAVKRYFHLGFHVLHQSVNFPWLLFRRTIDAHNITIHRHPRLIGSIHIGGQPYKARRSEFDEAIQRYGRL